MSEVSERHRILRQDDTGEYYSVRTGKAQHLHNKMLETEKIMKNSLNRSREIISKVEEEAKSQIDDASKKGFDKGYGEGYSKGLSEGRTIPVENLRPIADELKQLKEKIPECYNVETPKRELLDKAFELAQKIISIEIETNNEAFFGLYQKAAQHISNVDKATIKASGKNCREIEKNIDKYKNAIDGLNFIDTVELDCDDDYCVLETSLGTIETTASVQFERAKGIIKAEY